LNDQIINYYNVIGKFIILGVACPWTEKKGLSDFIKLSKGLDSSSVIILLGLSRKQIKRLPSGIIGLPRTENQMQLKEFYNSADVYLNLSVEETFGLTTAEALACGVPAIVYNSTACPEIIDENSGIIVEKRNLNELKNAIEVIKKKGKGFYSKACRQRAVRLYNKNQKFEEYFSLYENLLIKTK
jgi:glycosyltransferase involved in cell wall biosynthesis